ncbi:surface protease GP63 [Trypanosoma theileri]|uniref:Leishmanolysin-like peptidase n=1 Tax=Trypanosoma theileri TaxID=67003 RepID=A0A1X0NRY8_9TRYP|nr:surface protease GP63 [Trypanosoma theileri]ORC87243.1 surface protease GP63 [Trypanosoma theileri]
MKFHTLLLFLFVFCVLKCTAAVPNGCVFNEVMKMSGPPVSVVRELPKKGQGSLQAYTASSSNEWAPIRIVVSSEDLNDPSKYCDESFRVRPDYWLGINTSCNPLEVLTDAKKKRLLSEILPVAIKLHSDRLLVHRESKPVVVPTFTSEICSRFSVPNTHRTAGVSGADMVLYLAATPSNVWAVPCAEKEKRTIVATMNVSPSYIEEIQVISRLVAHELGHALGFNYNQFITLGMTKEVQGIRGKETNVLLINTSMTKKKAEEHYNCANIDGVELEEGVSEISHWGRRNAKDELMGFRDDNGIMLYTALTMATFEDMGVFKANWGMEETMRWGRNAGCEFLQQKCMVDNITKYPHMFCNTTNPLRCTSDRRALGVCNIVSNLVSLPEQFQYFTSNTVGGPSSDAMDHCPIVSSNLICSKENTGDTSASLLGRDSWCLDTDSLIVKYNDADVEMGGLCVVVKCDGNDVSVKYKGSDSWQKCHEGETITPKGSKFVSGSIICPKYNEVCTVAPDGGSLAKATSGDKTVTDTLFLPFISLVAAMVILLIS